MSTILGGFDGNDERSPKLTKARNKHVLPPQREQLAGAHHAVVRDLPQPLSQQEEERPRRHAERLFDHAAAHALQDQLWHGNSIATWALQVPGAETIPTSWQVPPELTVHKLGAQDRELARQKGTGLSRQNWT